MWWNTGTGCPEKLWMPPPWQRSRPGWMELWETWSSGRCPCSWQRGWNQMIFKIPSNPNHSMTLWFYDFIWLQWVLNHRQVCSGTRALSTRLGLNLGKASWTSAFLNDWFSPSRRTEQPSSLTLLLPTEGIQQWTGKEWVESFSHRVLKSQVVNSSLDSLSTTKPVCQESFYLCDKMAVVVFWHLPQLPGNISGQERQQ